MTREMNVRKPEPANPGLSADMTDAARPAADAVLPAAMAASPRAGRRAAGRKAGGHRWAGGIAGKLFLGFLGMAILTIALLWFIQAGLLRDSYLQSRVDAMDAAVRTAAASGSPNVDTLKTELNANLLILNNDGSTRSLTQGVPMMGMMLRTIQAMVPAEADGTLRIVETQSGATRYAVLGHAIKGGGYLFAVFSLADADEAARILRDQLWLITVILLASAVVFALLLARGFARPIAAVTGAARALAGGNLGVSLPVRSHDEIGELTEALNDLGIQLHQTESLRKELIANVSHELRAPLAVIRGYAEIVRDVSWPDEVRRTRQLNMIAEESARLSRVVTDILDYSKLQAGVERLNLARFSVLAAMEQAVSRHDLNAAERGLQIHWHAPEADVRFDRDKFDQVLDNLLNNALNHAPAGSVIDIAVQPAPDGADATVHRITVCNSGDDIPPEELPLIWDRYYRVQQVGEARRLGTGLGLSIVKSILQHHNVAFGVNSGEQKTCFWFETCPMA